MTEPFESLTEPLADLLCIRIDAADAVIDTATFDVDAELAAARAHAEAGDDDLAARNARAVQAAQQRMHGSAARVQQAALRAEAFLAILPDQLSAAVRGHRDYRERVHRALGGVARGVEAPLSRQQRRTRPAVRIEASGNESAAHWPEHAPIPLRRLAEAQFERLAEFPPELAAPLADAVLAALQRGDDVLPGLLPTTVGATAVYQTMPPTLAQPDATAAAPAAAADGCAVLGTIPGAAPVVEAVQVCSAMRTLQRPQPFAEVLPTRAWDRSATRVLVQRLATAARCPEMQARADLRHLLEERMRCVTMQAVLAVLATHLLALQDDAATRTG